MKAGILLALLLVADAAAMEQSDLAGLRVALQPIAEAVNVDGVPLQVRTATGRDVERLAGRIEARWRAEGSVVQAHEVAGWKVRSRFEDGRSEVLQWKGEDDAAQLLHSTLDAMRAPAKATRPPFRLPRSCAWGRVISGNAGPGSYEQRTAICAEGTAAVIRALRSRLEAQGWSVMHAAGGSLELARQGSGARLVVAPGPQDGQSTVVWLAATRQELR